MYIRRQLGDNRNGCFFHYPFNNHFSNFRILSHSSTHTPFGHSMWTTKIQIHVHLYLLPVLSIGASFPLYYQPLMKRSWPYQERALHILLSREGSYLMDDQKSV